MEVVVHRSGFAACHVVGQNLVQPIDELLAVDAFDVVEMAYHDAGVDAGIGASGPRYLHLMPKYARQTFLQPLLRRHAVGLDLPTVVGRAVEREGEEIALEERCGEADIGAVVEGDITLHETFGGLELPDVERVVGQLLFQLAFTLLQ